MKKVEPREKPLPWIYLYSITKEVFSFLFLFTQPLRYSLIHASRFPSWQ